MAFGVVIGVGVVGGVFLLMVAGEVFYLFHWKRRPLYPRGNSVPVAPDIEAEAVGVMGEQTEGAELIINVQCAEYQIAALHQDLVEKLFPALGVTSAEAAQDLMGPTRMLFTITEETKEDLDGLDSENRRNRKGGASRSKSMSEISLSPVGSLSPSSSSPFVTPPSSPDLFATPYGTPTYSPHVTLNRSHSASPILPKTPPRITNDLLNGSPPVGPPSPTRPSFPFLSRGSSPSQSPEFPLSNNNNNNNNNNNYKLEASEWCSPSPRHSSNKSSPALNAATNFYSPPRKPFIFGTPVIHGKQVEGGGLVKLTSPIRSCTYVYENSTFSPSIPTSPLCCPPSPLICTLGDHFSRENQQERKNLSLAPSTPPHSSPTTVGPGSPFFYNNNKHCTSHSDETVGGGFCTSPSCKPASQRSSSVLFPASFPRPSLSIPPPASSADLSSSSKSSLPDTGSSSPTESSASLSSSKDSIGVPFGLELPASIAR